MCCFEHERRTTFRKRIKFGHGVETDNMRFTWGMGAPLDMCRNNIIIHSTVLVNQCWNNPSSLFKLYLWRYCLHSENIPLIFSPSNFCWLTWADIIVFFRTALQQKCKCSHIWSLHWFCYMYSVICHQGDLTWCVSEDTFGLEGLLWRLCCLVDRLLVYK